MKSTSIQRLVSNGQYREALTFYTQSHPSRLLQTNSFTFPFLLKACSNLQLIPQTQQIHTHIIKSGFTTNPHTATALISTYMKLHLSCHALKVFEAMPNPTLPSVNALISGFSQSGHFKDSLDTFKRFNFDGFLLNSVTIAGVLPACQIVELGWQIHGLLIKLGHEFDVYVATALVTMYSNCKELGSALRVFRMIREKSIVSYNAMIQGSVQNGQFSMALDFFREMICSSIETPNSSTLLSLLSACSKISSLMLGKEIHCCTLKCGDVSNIMIGTALVDVYSKCGLMTWAYRVFTAMEDKNVVTWNTMISGFVSYGSVDLAVTLFLKLRSVGLKPDSATWNLMINGLSRHGNANEAFRFFIEMQFDHSTHPSLKVLTSLLQACSSTSNLRYGKEIHCHVIRAEVSYDDEFINTAMIHMYMNCGCYVHARRIFDLCEMKSRDPALWNAMISGYGRNGEDNMAIAVFREMRQKRVKPNSATFLSVLSACAHTSNVDGGCEFYKMMSNECGIKPNEEHLSCMVDLLGRAGKLDEAWEMVSEMRKPSASMYHSLLGACRHHLNDELGEVAVEKLLELEPWSSTSLVMMSNIYAEKGRWNDVERLRKVMDDDGLIKVQGCSWIGVKES